MHDDELYKPAPVCKANHHVDGNANAGVERRPRLRMSKCRMRSVFFDVSLISFKKNYSFTNFGGMLDLLAFDIYSITLNHRNRVAKTLTAPWQSSLSFSIP